MFALSSPCYSSTVYTNRNGSSLGIGRWCNLTCPLVHSVTSRIEETGEGVADAFDGLRRYSRLETCATLAAGLPALPRAFIASLRLIGSGYLVVLTAAAGRV